MTIAQTQHCCNDALATWAEQPVTWPVLQWVNDPDHLRWYSACDTPELRVKLAQTFAVILTGDTDSGQGGLPRTTIAKLVESLDDYEALGLAARWNKAPSFNTWIQDNPTPCGATCSDDCAQACAAGAI